MSNPISPADLSAARNAALQQRASTQLGREVRQSATGATTERPGDAVTLSSDPKAAEKAAETNATHLGLVKNDTKGTGDGTTAATTEAGAEKTGYEPLAKGPAPAGGPSLEYNDGAAGSSLPLGSVPAQSQNPTPTPGEPTPSPDPSAPPAPPASSERKDLATATAQAQAEEDQVRQIFMQMWSDRRKAMAEMWKIIQDTNTKIFEIIQGVAVNRAMSVQKSIDAWTQYIMM